MQKQTIHWSWRNKIIQKVIEGIVKPLTIICNLSFLTGQFPTGIQQLNSNRLTTAETIQNNTFTMNRATHWPPTVEHHCITEAGFTFSIFSKKIEFPSKILNIYGGMGDHCCLWRHWTTVSWRLSIIYFFYKRIFFLFIFFTMSLSCGISSIMANHSSLVVF